MFRQRLLEDRLIKAEQLAFQECLKLDVFPENVLANGNCGLDNTAATRRPSKVLGRDSSLSGTTTCIATRILSFLDAFDSIRMGLRSGV